MRFTRILIPIDLAEVAIAEPAIETGTEFVCQGGYMRLMTVLSLLPAEWLEFVPAGFDAIQLDRALDSLKGIGTQIALSEDCKSYNVRAGSIYGEILAEAETWGADLIIIGSHRPAMSSYLLGSNAKTVVRHAKCSVLVVRS
jgi:nucleotide-binding universal stress UspA family protein